jgi:hypothetical protein
MSVYIPVELRDRVRERFANCCAYCRTAEDLTCTTFEYEHIVSRSTGGETVFDNICLSCPMCNRYKSDRSSAQDPETQVEVPLFHPHRDQWSNHFAWNDEYCEIIGLTPIGRATVEALKMNRPQMTRIRRMWVAMGEHPPGD